jgi:hypothetical protein
VHIISRRLLAVPVLALASACAGEPEGAMTADLQKDLELATATSLELASARRTEVVSALERAEPGTAAEGDRVAAPAPRRRAPRAVAPVPLRTASDEAPAPAVEVAADAEPAEAPVAEVAPEAGDVAAEQAGEEETVQVGGPVVTSDGVGTGRPRDPGGWGGDLPLPGTGVVIRGGGVGDPDLCQIHRRPGRGGVVVVGGPVYGPVYGGGYPRGGSSEVGGRTRAGGSTARPRGPSPSSRPAPVSTGGRARARGGR